MTGIKKFSSISGALKELFGAEIENTDRLYGGDINDAFAITLSGGKKVFMKSNRRASSSFFAAEAAGLAAIARSGTIGAPKILGFGDENGRAFLLLEFIDEGRRASDFWETFGRQLAGMHKADADSFVSDGAFGFKADNYIGHTKQINTPKNSWIEFFRDCRLEPQFRMAERFFSAPGIKRANLLLDRLDGLLIEPDHPSLLHGDLWSGNFMTGSDGRAWIIDPAAYVGHAEADIAMTELFGGFHRKFYAAYNEAAPIERGYEDRRDLYNLYQLLNHLNMFGGSYLSSVMRIVRRYA